MRNCGVVKQVLIFTNTSKKMFKLFLKRNYAKIICTNIVNHFFRRSRSLFLKEMDSTKTTTEAPAITTTIKIVTIESAAAQCKLLHPSGSFTIMFRHSNKSPVKALLINNNS